MSLFDLEPQGGASPAGRAWGFREARALQVALRLGLFDRLEESPRSGFALASELACDPEMTERLLIVLAAMRLVSRGDGRWRNRPVASRYLVRGHPLYQGAVIELGAQMWDRYGDLERLVREGVADGETLRTLDERRDPSLLGALGALALAGRAQRLARLVTAMAARRRLLDVEGAPGAFSIALCERYPRLQVTLLDAPEALEEAREMIETHGMTERITRQAGDLRQAPLGGGGYDALLYSRLFVGSEREALDRFMRAYEALEPGGLLIVRGRFLDNDEGGPLEAALERLTEGGITLDELHSALAEAGFERISIRLRDPEEGDIVTAVRMLESAEVPPEIQVAMISPEQELLALLGASESDANGLTIQRGARRGVIEPN